MRPALINKSMKVEEVILGFPQNALRLRRMMRNVLPCSGELPNEPIETFLFHCGKKSDEIDLFVERMNAVLEDQGIPNTISLTQRAAVKLKELLSKNGKIEGGIRISDQAAACGTGYEYVLEFSDCSQADDVIFYSHNIPICSPKQTVKRFLGALIDYEDEVAQDQHFTGLMQLGFSIFNPNVTTSCVCGCSSNYTESALT